MATAAELRAKSGDIAMRARELFADETKRDEVKRMLDEHDALEAQIDLADRLDRAEARSNAIDETLRPKLAPGKMSAEARTAAYNDAVLASLRARKEGEYAPETRAALNAGFETRDGQTVGSSSAGGITVPTILDSQIVTYSQFFNAMNPTNVTFFNTDDARPLIIVQRDSTQAKGKFVAETANSTANAVTYTDVTVSGYVADSEIYKVSWELQSDSNFDIVADLAEHMGETLGRLKNDRLTNGTGSSEPTGILNAINAPTLVSSANSTTMTIDDFLNLEGQVDQSYRQNPKTAYMFNDSVRLQARLMKDLYGRPLWQPALTLGDQPTINGYKYIINPAMPNKATNASFMLFGDMSRFRVRQVKYPLLTRFDELFAVSRQTGFRLTERYDSVLVDKRAIKAIKGL